MSFDWNLINKSLILDWNSTSSVTTPKGDNTKERPLICQCVWEKGDSEYIDYNISKFTPIKSNNDSYKIVTFFRKCKKCGKLRCNVQESKPQTLSQPNVQKAKTPDVPLIP